MVTKSFKGVAREELMAAIRKATEAQGGKRLARAKFTEASGYSSRHLYRHFSSWREAVEAAGCKYQIYRERVPAERMLEAWGAVARKLGRRPTYMEYRTDGGHTEYLVNRRFGRWSRVPEAFREYTREKPEWADVVALLPAPGTLARPYRRSGPHPYARVSRGLRPEGRITDRPVCGEPLDFCGLRHAPANELGVVLLFGAMAKGMGFLIESVQARFPDCEAKRRTGPNAWQSVRIEFEHESRNFHVHGHPAEGCDIIVCWEHNWPECPENIEVIALKEHVERLRNKGS